MDQSFADILVDSAAVGPHMPERKSVITVQSILNAASGKSQNCHLDDGQELVTSLQALMDHNSFLWKQAPAGTAKQNAGDVGTIPCSSYLMVRPLLHT
jgi:hypothetical protein